MSGFDDVDETMLQALYDSCTDPAKGTLDEFRVTFLNNRKAKVIVGIRASKKWSGVPPLGRNHFPE